MFPVSKLKEITVTSVSSVKKLLVIITLDLMLHIGAATFIFNMEESTLSTEILAATKWKS